MTSPTRSLEDEWQRLRELYGMTDDRATRTAFYLGAHVFWSMSTVKANQLAESFHGFNEKTYRIGPNAD